MNNKAQAQSIIILFVFMIAIFITSIIVLRVTNSILTPFQQQLNATGMTGSVEASGAVGFAQSRFTTWWDVGIVLIFLFNIITLLVSAFMVDIHPAFLLIYIISIIFLFIFGNTALYALDAIWGAMGTDTETAQTPIQQFLINNYSVIMLGIVILSGVVMYAKFRFFGGQGAGGNY